MKSHDFADPERFGVFEFDPKTGELRKQGLRVKITHRAAQLLSFLLESPGRIRTRAELKQRLWPENTFTDFEHGLNKAVFALRKALGDSAANPRFVETLPSQGYRFIPIFQGLSQPVLKARVSESIESLAILPFLSENTEPELEFVGHQIALRLIDRFSSVSGLRVLAYSTVKHYRQQLANPLMAGRDWGVRAVVAGEFIRQSGDLLLHVELVDVSDGTQLWGAQLKQPAQQVLEHLDEISDQISQQLTPILASSEAQLGPKLIKPTSSVVAQTGHVSSNTSTDRIKTG